MHCHKDTGKVADVFGPKDMAQLEALYYTIHYYTIQYCTILYYTMIYYTIL